MTLLNTNDGHSCVLNEIMQEWLNYQTNRFAYLKKDNKLGSYNKKDCDIYRDLQTFDSDINGIFKGKKTTKFDARYSRAIDINIQARCSSLLELKKIEIEDKEIKVETINKKINKVQTKIDNVKKNPWFKVKNQYDRISLNTLKNKLVILNNKIESLKLDIKEKRFNGIVFGGNNLWKEQRKKHIDIKYWKEKWKNRGDEFECGGSKSEEYGNKKFHLSLSQYSKENPSKRAKFDLKIMLPYLVQEEFGKSMTIHDIYFENGEKLILDNVKNHEQYKNDLSNYNKEKKKIENIENEELSLKLLSELGEKPSNSHLKSFYYLIKRKGKKYYCHVTIEKDTIKNVTSDKNGVIGIDINYDNIAFANINRSGKLIYSKVLKFNFGHKNSSSHREQMINQSIKELVQYAKRKKKDVIIEKLDFSFKKSQSMKGNESDVDYNRMIHRLAYAKIKERIRIQCLENGVKLIPINPAYTSMLGRTLYTKPHGISVHEAASYVISRRHFNLKEEYKERKISFLYKDRACEIEIPERIFKEQEKLTSFKFWAKLYAWMKKEFKAPSRFYKKVIKSEALSC